MQAELTTAGFQDLHTAQEVENAIKRGNNLVVVNSYVAVARNARPGAK
jgi:putative YphP/YqiW family bacilliredoxin